MGNISRRETNLIALAAIILISMQLINCQSISDQNSNGRSPSNFFSLFLSPLKASFKQAQQFIGHPIKGVHDGVDGVREQAFKIFMSLYNKTYSPEEIPLRMALFFDRRKQIEESVKAFQEGRLPFMMRENAFVDWSEEEIKGLTGVSLPSPNDMEPEERESLAQGENEISDSFGVKNLKVSHNSQDEQNDDSNMMVKAESIPATKDWRTTNCISTPINQLKCGACYAIATMSVVESMRCLNQVSSPILSPQQIVDCSTPRAGYENYGCDGGWPTRVLKYLQDVGVATRETCYPFVRRQSACRLRQVQSSSGCAISASPTDSQLRYKVLNNERDILYHVAKTGPVVTVMKATDNFLYYGSGIFDDKSCSRRRDDVDHAIVIVGYGRENGQDYWLIKNSWGTTTWGIGGYGKYKRGSNVCSIGHWGWVLTS